MNDITDRSPLPRMSPFTLLTASLSPSTLLAISLANRFLPSSLTISASSLLWTSSNSSCVSEIGLDRRKDLSTGEEAIVDEERRECRYDRNVSRFFSRARREGAEFGWEDVEGSGEPGSSHDENWREVNEGVALSGALTVVRSFAGGARICSSGCAFWSCRVRLAPHG